MNVVRGLGILASAAWLFAAAAAVAFDAAALDRQDRAALQEMLEFGRSNSESTLPSGRTVTIVQTDLEPRVCRHFVLESGGAQQRGMGCRTGQGTWDFGVPAGGLAGPSAVPQQPQQVAASAPPPQPTPPTPGRRTVNLRDLPLDLAAPQGTVPQGMAPQGAETESPPTQTQVAALVSQPVAGAPFTPPLPAPRPSAVSADLASTDPVLATSDSAEPDDASASPGTAPDVPLPRRRPASGAPVVAAPVVAAGPGSQNETDPSAVPGGTPPDIPLPRRRPGMAPEGLSAETPQIPLPSIKPDIG